MAHKKRRHRLGHITAKENHDVKAAYHESLQICNTGSTKPESCKRGVEILRQALENKGFDLR